MNTNTNGNFTILSWNIRGINNAIAKSNLRNFIAKYDPIITFVQETKSEELSVLVLDSVWSSMTHDWVQSPATGQSGGLLTTWDYNRFTVLNNKSDTNWIWIRGNLKDNPKVIANLFNIYAPHKLKHKEGMWEKIQLIMDSYQDESFFFMGDFNSIRDGSECLNCGYRQKYSSWLNGIITNINLWDVTNTNYQFTWFGPQEKSSKLDRALLKIMGPYNSDWTLKGIGRKSSDHVCLLLSSRENANWGPKPCKPFEI